MQFNLKVERKSAQLLRLLARADGRTISGFISVHFLSRLTPEMLPSLRQSSGLRGNGVVTGEALSPPVANELSDA